MPKYFAQFDHGLLVIHKYVNDTEYERTKYYRPCPTTIVYQVSDIDMARVKAKQLFNWSTLGGTK